MLELKDAKAWETVKRPYGFVTRVDIIDPVTKEIHNEMILHEKTLTKENLDALIQHRIDLLNSPPVEINDRMISEREVLSILREKGLADETVKSIDDVKTKAELIAVKAI